jgi:hypothetical protein
LTQAEPTLVRPAGKPLAQPARKVVAAGEEWEEF